MGNVCKGPKPIDSHLPTPRSIAAQTPMMDFLSIGGDEFLSVADDELDLNDVASLEEVLSTITAAETLVTAKLQEAEAEFAHTSLRVPPVKKSAPKRRCLALVSHNNMKSAMQAFVQKNKDVLKHYRITGTSSTMQTVKDIFGEEKVELGPTCNSGPLGGDAEIAAILTRGDLGGMIFFADPLSPHPHIADVHSLIRLCNVHNVLWASNPTSGEAMIHVLKAGVIDPSIIPSFYHSLESPSVDVYKQQQKELIAKLKAQHRELLQKKKKLTFRSQQLQQLPNILSQS